MITCFLSNLIPRISFQVKMAYWQAFSIAWRYVFKNYNLSSRELSTFFHPETADLVTFTEEVLNRKLHLWCSIVTYGYLHCCDLWISTSTLSLCKSLKTSLILCFLKFILLYLHRKNKKNIRHRFWDTAQKDEIFH